MAAFATTDDLTSFLQRPTLTGTALAAATLALDLASGAIRATAGQAIDRVIDDVVTLAAPAAAELVLPERPADEPTDVQIEGATVTDWSFDGVDTLYRASGWRAYDDATGQLLRVRVTYSHGYATIPDEIRRVCLQVAARAMSNPKQLSGEGIGDYQASGMPPVDLTQPERRAVRRAVGSGRAFFVDTVWWQ